MDNQQVKTADSAVSREIFDIIEYDNSYRDDMIFMVLQAKDALGRKPSINSDLLDVKKAILTVEICFGLR